MKAGKISVQLLYQTQSQWRLVLSLFSLPACHQQWLLPSGRLVLGLQNPGLLVKSLGMEASALLLLSAWRWPLRTQISTVSLAPGSDGPQALLLTALLSSAP